MNIIFVMEYGIQEILKKIGDEGCYFLCLLKAANVPQSKIVDAYCECLEHGYISEDCYINDPIAILRLFGVGVSRVEKTTAGTPIPNQPKFIVACYEFGRYSHFVLVDKNGLWDSLGESNTVRHGKVKSYRLFY